MPTTTSSAPTLPTSEEYHEVAEGLRQFVEREVEPILDAVGRVINYSGEQEATFADLGRLWSMIDSLEASRGDLDDVIARLKSTLVNVDAIRLEGQTAHEPPINEFGNWTPGYGRREGDA